MATRIIIFLLTFCLISGCKSAEDYFSEGQDLSSEGNFKSAISKFNQAIHENQYMTDSYIQMGICYEYMNQHDSAIHAYSELLKLYPENTAANYYSGVSKYRQQKFNEAIFYYDKALDTKGGFNAADTNSIQALIDLYKDNFESENAEIDIPTREILYDRAMAYYKAGKLKMACADFSNCILQKYNPGTSYYMIGLCRLAKKEMKYAREAFFRASNYGDSLAMKKLSFLENSNVASRSSVRKKTL